MSPGRAARLVCELEDHYADTALEFEERGYPVSAAKRQAQIALGDLELIARDACGRSELKSWAWHWPRLARVVYPLAFVLALPVAPVVIGMQHAQTLLRWAACVLLGGLITGSMLFFLQWSIHLG